MWHRLAPEVQMVLTKHNNDYVYKQFFFTDIHSKQYLIYFTLLILYKFLLILDKMDL